MCTWIKYPLDTGCVRYKNTQEVCTSHTILTLQLCHNYCKTGSTIVCWLFDALTKKVNEVKTLQAMYSSCKMQGPPSPQEPKVLSNPFLVSQIDTFFSRWRQAQYLPVPIPHSTQDTCLDARRSDQIRVGTSWSPNLTDSYLRFLFVNIQTQKT